jgi:hypothetical protein
VVICVRVSKFQKITTALEPVAIETVLQIEPGSRIVQVKTLTHLPHLECHILGLSAQLNPGRPTFISGPCQEICLLNLFSLLLQRINSTWRWKAAILALQNRAPRVATWKSYFTSGHSSSNAGGYPSRKSLELDYHSKEIARISYIKPWMVYVVLEDEVSGWRSEGSEWRTLSRPGDHR